LSRDTIESGSGQAVVFGRLLNHIGYASGPYRNRHLLTQIDHRRALARLAAVTDGDPGGEGSGDAEGEAASEETVRSSVLQRLQEQVNGLARPEGGTDPAHDLSRLKQTIEKLEQTSGVANVAAMHDVELLQVAFEPA